MYGTRMETYVVGANGGCGVAPVLFLPPFGFLIFIVYITVYAHPPH